MPNSDLSGTIEVFIGRHGDGWRLYAHGWVPTYLRQKLDPYGEAFPVREPNLDELDPYMWSLDAPYTKRVTNLGGVELVAHGRSAIMLWEWLDGLISPGSS